MATRHYLFRTFRLDPAARELHDGDDLVVLPASALDCLVYLVEHRERAVGRDELISAVWGRTDVADTLLAQTILRVRRALGDSGSDGAIRTIARFGYRWIEETREVGEANVAASPTVVAPPVDGDSAEAPVAPVPVAGASVRDGTRVLARRRDRGMPVAVVLVLVVAIATATWWSGRDAMPQGDAASSATDVQEVPALVMPADVPGTSDWSWLRVGLIDVVGHRLREAGVPAAPSESVFAMLGPDGTARELPAGTLRIAPTARVRDGQWTVRLHVQRDGQVSDVEASSSDVLQATRSATDLLLVRLGHEPPRNGEQPRPIALEELLQRTRGALLADQFDLALHLITQAPDEVRAHPEIALRLAQIDQGRGDYAAAEARLAGLVDALPADVSAALRGRVLGSLGAVRFRRGDAAGAADSYAEAIRVLEPAHDPLALAAAYSGRAAIASQQERLDEAAADLGRARVEMEAAGDALGLAQVDMNLGLVESRNYRPAQALPILVGAEARIASLGAREELAYVRFALVGVRLQMLDLADALETIQRCWPPETHTGNPRMRWRLVLSKAFVLIGMGRLGEAEALLVRIGTEADPKDDADIRARAVALAGIALAARGRHEDAVARTEASLAPAFAEDSPDLYVSTWTVRLRSLRQLGRLDAAEAETAALAAWIEAHPNPWRRVHAALTQAEQAWARSPDEAALAQFASAFMLAGSLGIPDDLVEVAERYVAALLERGEIDQASAVVGRIAPWADRDLRAAWAQAQLYRAQDRVDAWQRSTERVLQLAGERALPAPRID